MPSDVLDQVRAAADHGGLSVSEWLAGAARRELKRLDGLAALAEWEAEAGPIPEDAHRWARQTLYGLDGEAAEG